jgi:hypothetical protein
MVVVFGVPYDENSSFMQGPASAPARIREVLHSGSMNLCSENEIDLGEDPHFHDLGDLDLSIENAAFESIEKAMTTLLERNVYVLSLGGDHAITYPILKAYAKKYDKLSILHLDAHPDLYDAFEANRYSHTCPFARIMEENLANLCVLIKGFGINFHCSPPNQRSSEGWNNGIISNKKAQCSRIPYFFGSKASLSPTPLGWVLSIPSFQYSIFPVFQSSIGGMSRAN